MKKYYLYISILIFLISGFSEISFSGAPKTTKKKKVIITGNKIKSKLIGKSAGRKIYLTELTGNPRIKTGSVLLRTDKIIIHDSIRGVAECRGRVTLIDRKNRSVIRAGRALFYKEENRVELLNNPLISARREDDNSRVTLRAGKIIYYIGQERAEAHGRVYVKNRDIRINSEKATFLKPGKRISFIRNPIIRKKADTFKADEIIYNMEKKVIFLKKNATITTYSEEKDSKTGKIKKVKSVTQGDHVEHHEGGEKLTIISGNAVIERPEATYRGRRIEIIGKDSDQILGNDIHIIYKEESSEVFGKEFKYNKKEKYGTLWGNPVINIKDRKTGDVESRIYGEFMEFFRDIDELHINGNVIILSNTEKIMGEMARYVRKEKNIYVTGNSRIERDGAFVFADIILYNTVSSGAKLIGNIRGTGIK